MGVVIGRMDDQVEKIFLGNNLTRSTKNYDKILEDENLPEEERNKKFDENVKPLIMQAGSTIIGTVISVMIATALAKAGIKNAMH